MRYFRIILAIGLIIIGVFRVLGIWFPSIRGSWGKREFKERDRVPAGLATCVGGALLFISLGLAFLWGDAISKPFAIGAAACILCGFVLTLAGLELDARAHERRRGAYRLPHDMRFGTPDEQRRWIFVGIGVFILVMVLLVLVFHG